MSRRVGEGGEARTNGVESRLECNDLIYMKCHDVDLHASEPP